MSIYRCAGRKRLDDDGDPLCSYQAPHRWRGRCPECGRHYDCDKIGADKRPVAPTTFGSLVSSDTSKIEYHTTGQDYFDEVLGGGLVKGAVIQFGGQRGAGKTTQLIQVAGSTAREGRRVLYASGEMSADQLGVFCRRLNAANEHVQVMDKESAKEVELVLERAKETRAFLIIFDSLQSMVCAEAEGPRGSAAQGVAVAKMILDHCKKTGACAIIINHLSKQGSFAGSETVAHDVDTILVLGFPDDKVEEDKPYLRDRNVRVLFIDDKNRYGPEDVRKYLNMTPDGLKAAPPPNELAGRRSRRRRWD